VTLLELLDQLERADIKLGTNVHWRLRTLSPPGAITDEIRMAIRRHHDLLVWTVIARGTGHVWCPCDRCGQPVLLHPALHGDGNGKQVWPRCYLTPACPGRHKPPERNQP
jgi:hypothetical protein